MSQTLWDISPPISHHSPVFPGDTPYRQQWTWTLSEQCPVNVSSISMSPHVGAHADAPLHYAPNQPSAGEMALAPFLGPCRVIHVLGGTDLIRPHDIEHALADIPPRVLVRTYRAAPPTQWQDQFAAYAPETIDLLHAQGVMLIGIDTPSIDPASSKQLESHQRILSYDMRVLENLVLTDVDPGDYELIALPLKLIDADASPVRAILRRL
ncbi:arylformamidase [Paenalcaligenes hominis]|uniref:Kynurenine formamidase n=1 Tax=Paenalcaligenes hominis TaxID=643674 RepID=A0A1U9JZP3_9BURK|nr:arylformamidase [Paenalcaligenes hominis]AQS51273.1 arylformamidase [Paenalcaligenes hominis]